jgi:hypothetical protein
MPTQTYYLKANSVGPQSVRETDDAYVIEDVPFIRPMELAGGYVPEQSVRETAGAWDGVPATLNHPRDDSGRPVAANEQPETHIGVTENPTYDGTHVRGDIRLSKARLDALGAEAADIERALEDGTTVDVSSQYAAAELPSGEYDGEVRDNVEAIARPDSVAILPNTTGVCSIEDGCGINPQMAANAAVTVPMTANGNDSETDMSASADAEFSEGDLVRWSTSQGSPGTGRVAAVVTEPGESVSADGADVTRTATEDEAAYKLDNWTGDEFDSGVVVKSESEMVGKWSDAPDAAMTANMDVPAEYRHDNPGEAVEQAQEMGFDGAGDEIIHTHDDGDATVFMPAPSHEELVATLRDMGELPGDTESNRMHGNAVRSALRTLTDALSVAPAADDDVSPKGGQSEEPGESSRGVRTDELIEEYGFSADNLPAESTRCFDKIYANVTADGADAAATDDEPMSDDTIELDDLSDDAHETLVDEAVERIEANRAEDKKDDLVTEIIANSADHDSDDRDTLLDTPVDVLETLAANVGDSTAGVPAMGQTANAAVPSGDDDVSEYPDGTIGGDL